MSPPRTIRQLAEESKKYEFTPGISFRSWIHVARTMLNQADIYRQEEVYEESYILYSRFADLIINSLPRHPELKSSATAKKQLKEFAAKVPDVLERLELVKGALEKGIEAYKSRQSSIEQARKRVERLKQLKQEQYHRQPPTEGEQPRTSTSGSNNNNNNSNDDKEYMETLSTLKRLRAKDSYSPVDTNNNNAVINWSYPSVPKQRERLHTTSPGNEASEDLKPTLPPKQNELETATTSASLPSPPKSEQSEIVHKSRTCNEGGVPLRTTFLPPQLRDSFLEVARKNTENNLETCGILCGKLNRNAFFITHLVIPHQEATSDTTTTTNEHILFEYVDTNDLFILGWIHTHPSQSCFLSSIDLHTQNSYQIMLPEAVAIVCAPKYDPSWGIFRLTDPDGIEIIKRCPITSTFHPHDESNLYRLAYNPGHVIINSGLDFTLKDLRSIPP